MQVDTAVKKELQEFEQYVNKLWEEGLSSDLIRDLPLQKAFQDKRVVAIYLTQVYHYAVHTPRHQAMVAVNPANTNVKYMQYCFHHALDETGHELMALKDLRSLGFDVTPENMPTRLPSTDLLIAYLYAEAQKENPIHHLGYGFWSENACPFISDFMSNLMDSMQLNTTQMTFYSSHVTIDESHAQEVRDIIETVAKTEEDWIGMRRVAKVTLDLTVGIVRDTLLAYDQLMKGQSDEFKIFK